MNFDKNELKTNNEIELQESSFQQLFKLYDPQGTGSIKTEDFIKITQELIKDSNIEQADFNNLVNELDPLGIGFLSCDQLKKAIEKLTDINGTNNSSKDNGLIDDFDTFQNPITDKDLSVVPSPFSNNTFSEYDIEASLNMTKDDQENVFFSLDNTNIEDRTNVPYSQSSSNLYEQSLSKKKKILRDRTFQSLPFREQIPDIIHDKARLSTAITDDAIENYENHLKISEEKISELSQQVDHLSNENKDLCNQIDRLKSDYELIIMKYTELEKSNELNYTLQQTINQLKIENSKLKEEFKCSNSWWNDERDIWSKKNEELNKQVNLLRIENTRISEELNEVINKNEKNEEDFRKLTESYRKIINENQKLENEKNFITDEMSNQLNEYCDKIDMLEQKLEIVKAENENLKNILTSTIINEATQPVQNIQDEKLSSDNINVESVNTKINHLFDDEPNISSTYGVTSGSSLAAEMETSSKDDLLARLNDEKQANLRLREYMDKIMFKVWDKNPELFLSCVGIKNK